MIFYSLVAKYQYLLDTFLNICKEIGVSTAQDKTLCPFSKLSFLVIELDCEAQEARLPEEKLIKRKAILESSLQKKKISLLVLPLEYKPNRLHLFAKCLQHI